jgi:hypothetical protein
MAEVDEFLFFTSRQIDLMFRAGGFNIANGGCKPPLVEAR